MNTRHLFGSRSTTFAAICVLLALSPFVNATDRSVLFDFDGDGKTDISVYRHGAWTIAGRETSVFYVKSSATGATLILPWGLGGDRPTPADFDNDGITDIAVHRTYEETLEDPTLASDYWIKYSSGGYSHSYFLTHGLMMSRNFFGSGHAEKAVFTSRPIGTDPSEPCDAFGLLIEFETNTFQKDIMDACIDDSKSHSPALGDYNNDGISDIAIYVKPNSGGESGHFELWNSPHTPGFTEPDVKFPFKIDFPIPGDYDGDGKTDFAGGTIENFRIHWRIKKSSNGAISKLAFGYHTDKPVPGDYDGDGKTDVAIVRPEQSGLLWYILRSSDGNWQVERFGAMTDSPIPQPNSF